MRITDVKLSSEEQQDLIQQIARYIVEASNTSNQIAQNPKSKEKTRLEEMGFKDAGQYIGYRVMNMFVDKKIVINEADAIFKN